MLFFEMCLAAKDGKEGKGVANGRLVLCCNVRTGDAASKYMCDCGGRQDDDKGTHICIVCFTHRISVLS